MSRKDHTELVCVIDRSGSMKALQQEAIGGFNSFLDSQRQVPGTASVTLVLFDHEYKVPYENVDLKTVQNLTDKTYVPRGLTALLDAIGRAIDDVGARLAKAIEEKRPEKVMVCILTDGLENASKEFTYSKIKEMIEHQRDKYKWEFSFLAANQDAFAEAGSMGISKQMTHNYAATGAGTKSALRAMSSFATSYRTGN